MAGAVAGAARPTSTLTITSIRDMATTTSITFKAVTVLTAAIRVGSTMLPIGDRCHTGTAKRRNGLEARRAMRAEECSGSIAMANSVGASATAMERAAVLVIIEAAPGTAAV